MEPSLEEYPSPPQPTNPMNVGFALVAAFAIGLALGFWGRPQIIGDVPIQVVVTVVPETGAEGAAPNSPSTSNPTSTRSAAPVRELDPAGTPSSPATAADTSASVQETPTIMDFVMADARHIDGSMDAPVTIIDFSDFK